MLNKFFKELKIMLTIWLIVMIPFISLLAFHKDIAAIIWIAIASAIGGAYVHYNDNKLTN